MAQKTITQVSVVDLTQAAEQVRVATDALRSARDFRDELALRAMEENTITRTGIAHALSCSREHLYNLQTKARLTRAEGRLSA